MSHTGAHPIVNPTSVRVEADFVGTTTDLSSGSVAIASVGTSLVSIHSNSAATGLVALNNADSTARIEIRDKDKRHILGLEVTFKGSLNGHPETIGVEVRPTLSLVQDRPGHQCWVTAEALVDSIRTVLTLKLSQRRPSGPHVRIPSAAANDEIPTFDIETETIPG